MPSRVRRSTTGGPGSSSSMPFGITKMRSGGASARRSATSASVSDTATNASVSRPSRRSIASAPGDVSRPFGVYTRGSRVPTAARRAAAPPIDEWPCTRSGRTVRISARTRATAAAMRTVVARRTEGHCAGFDQRAGRKDRGEERAEQPRSPRREVAVHAPMGADDPSPRRLPDAHAAVVHDLRVRREPHLPTRVQGAGSPVDSLPVEEVRLVLETDLGDRFPSNEVARLVPATDTPLLVVRPTVPPEAARSLPPEALHLPPEQRIAKRREIAGGHV